MNSNLFYESNIYPLQGDAIPAHDKHFLEKIQSPEALKLLNQNSILTDHYNLNQIQDSIYYSSSLRCVYSFPGDNPFGTRFIDGRAKSICKCIKLGCPSFETCRDTYSISEIKDLESNKAYWAKISQKHIYEVIRKKNQTIKIAPAKKIPVKAVENINQPDTVVNNEIQDETIKQKSIEEHIEKPIEKSKTISFSSFKETTQKEIIELPVKDRLIINAGPGTGKTYTLVEKVKYMIANQKIDPSHILILCFSRAAVKVIKDRIEAKFDNSDENYNLLSIDVRTFDSFGTLILANMPDDMKLKLSSNYSLLNKDYEQRMFDAQKIIKEFPYILQDYEHIFIDELQDLVDQKAEFGLVILKAIEQSKCGFTLLGDACQAIYDYQRKFAQVFLTSQDFYTKRLFVDFSDCKFLELTENHRQSGNPKLAELAVPLRKMILDNKIELKGIESIKNNLQNFFSPPKHIKDCKKGDLLKYSDQGTVGILTRTSGEALQIDSWFRKNNIDCNLIKRTDGKMNIDSWVYDVFESYNHELIDEEEFSKILRTKYPLLKESDIKNSWESLIPKKQEKHYDVNNLFKKIINGEDVNGNNYIYRNFNEKETNITVSNIHQAKGREFDTVILSEDIFNGMARTFIDVNKGKEDSQSILDEGKTLYVAITRPKNYLYKTLGNDTKDSFICTNYEDGRCFKTHVTTNMWGTHGSNIEKFEIGYADDFDLRSFATSKQIQDLIKKLQPDSPITLSRDDKYCQEYDKIRYRVTADEKPDVILGYTSNLFSGKMLDIYYDRLNYHSFKYSYAPSKLTNLYIDRKITCISPDRIGIKEFKKVGSYYIWLGLDIKGFGEKVN